jgi:hypothetical protein
MKMSKAANIQMLNEGGYKAQALRMAESESLSVTQDWEKEATEYTFADGTVLRSSGPVMEETPLSRLQWAIKALATQAGPVTFTAEEVEDRLVLTATYSRDDSPDDQPLTDEPWTEFGGYKILEQAGYDIGCGNAGIDSDSESVWQWVSFAK